MTVRHDLGAYRRLRAEVEARLRPTSRRFPAARVSLSPGEDPRSRLGRVCSADTATVEPLPRGSLESRLEWLIETWLAPKKVPRASKSRRVLRKTRQLAVVSAPGNTSCD